MTRFQQRLARGTTFLLVTLTTVTGTVMTRPAAAAADPPFVGWTVVLPPASNAFAPNSSDDHHNAVFSLAYLRTTEFSQRAAQETGFFADNPFVAHEDALFDRYYFQRLLTWREAAWRHAEQLVDAPDDAAVTAHSIIEAQAYHPPVTSTHNRDGYCAVHHG